MPSASAAYLEAREMGDLARWLDFHDGAAPVTPLSFPWLTQPAQRTVRMLLWGLTCRLRRHSRRAVEDPVTTADILTHVLAFVGPAALAPSAAEEEILIGSPRDALRAEPRCWGFSLARGGLEHIFVRVVTANATFGPDELNALYGRYGFVRAVLVNGASGMPVAAAEAGNAGDNVVGREALTIDGWNKPLYRFHFVVSVESASAAESAIAEVFNSQVDFVAFAVPPDTAADPQTTRGRERYSIAELPGVEAACASSFSAAACFFALDGSDDASKAFADVGGFVPDLAVDNVPYHTTAEQLQEYFAQFGTVTKVQLATSDRSGAFLGCALVRMSTFAEAVRASDMHGKVIGGEEVVCGVLDPELNIVSIVDPDVVLQESSRSAIAASTAGMAAPVGSMGTGGPSRSTEWGSPR